MQSPPEITISSGNRPFDQLLRQRQAQLSDLGGHSLVESNLNDIANINGYVSGASSFLPKFDLPDLANSASNNKKQLEDTSSRSLDDTRASIGLVSIDLTRSPDKLNAARLTELTNRNKCPFEPEHVVESRLLNPFQTPDCTLKHSRDPKDESVKDVFKASNGSVRTVISHRDGSTHEEVCDRYNKQLFVRNITPHGQNSNIEIAYTDKHGNHIQTTRHSNGQTHEVVADKYHRQLWVQTSDRAGNLSREERQYPEHGVSPFPKSKLIVNASGSVGTVTELTYNLHGGIANRLEYQIG